MRGMYISMVLLNRSLLRNSRCLPRHKNKFFRARLLKNIDL